MHSLKIFLDAGHGGHDPGAVFADYQEKNIALGITVRLGARLFSAGHEILYTRTDDTGMGLTERCAKANRWPADVFVSVHLNADPDADLMGMHEAHGSEIWIYPGSKVGREIAQSVATELRVRFPNDPFRGIKEDDLAVVRMTTMPAILIECGFIDHRETAATLHQPVAQDQFAAAVAAGICRWGELNFCVSGL